jgi:[acyl-carrier-protein] S-malonyltransferase
MQPIAILCSGQGAQHAGMFDLVAQAPEAQPVFAAASAVLGEDPRDYVRRAASDALFSNRRSQILCCTQALAAWAALGASRPMRAVIAGYSVGELAAWGCGGLFDAATTLRIAAQRAEAMDAVAPQDGGLAGILGLPQPMLENLLVGHDACIAIVNGVDSFVIGGLRADLEAICAQAMSGGARHAVMIRIAVPSHTHYLAEATPKLAAILTAAKPARPSFSYRILSGIDGDQIHDVAEAVDKLARQVSCAIDWAACLESCRSAGAQIALELGPGSALSRMAGDLFPAGHVRSADDFRSIDGLKRWLARVMETDRR